MEGQISLTDYLKSKIVNKEVMDLTEWINSHGKSQYRQIGEVIKEICKEEKVTEQLIARLTNAVSIYVLEQSAGYKEYLREESEV